MENQRQEEVILEEVVETEGKTKKFMPGWLKDTLLVVGGIALGVGASMLAGGKSKDQDDMDYIESSEVDELKLLNESSEDSYGIKTEE